MCTLIVSCVFASVTVFARSAFGEDSDEEAH